MLRGVACVCFLFHSLTVICEALDDLEPALGPLEYVRGSHKWGEGRTGSANQFYDTKVRVTRKVAVWRCFIEEYHSVV